VAFPNEGLDSKLRILISAYGCAPERGSEPGVGWNWSLHLARFHEIWVLTPEREKAAIQSYPKEELPSTLHFVHCDLPRFIRPRSPGTTLEYVLHYHLWQIWAYFIARKLHKRYSFNIVHHLTLGAHWKPSLLSLLPIPFIWGPLGGGESLPSSFWSHLGWNGRFFEIVRNLVRILGEMDPLVRLTAKRSVLTLAKTEDTARRARALKCRDVRVFSEAGLPDSELEKLRAFPAADAGPIRFLSLGRLLHWKGFEIGLRAFAQIHNEVPEATFSIVGDGPERDRLEQVARNLAIVGKVEFCGKLSRADALEKLAECSVLVHPSLHDSGGWVCLEAMAAGRPVICLDLGGPGTQITEDVGFKIAAHSPQQCIDQIASVMRMLANDRRLVMRMGLAGRAHVSQKYAWQKKALAISTFYSACADNFPNQHPNSCLDAMADFEHDPHLS
jgi:glycosyltransferase involved in cell wall biosynthesis